MEYVHKTPDGKRKSNLKTNKPRSEAVTTTATKR